MHIPGLTPTPTEKLDTGTAPAPPSVPADVAPLADNILNLINQNQAEVLQHIAHSSVKKRWLIRYLGGLADQQEAQESANSSQFLPIRKLELPAAAAASVPALSHASDTIRPRGIGSFDSLRSSLQNWGALCWG